MGQCLWLTQNCAVAVQVSDLRIVLKVVRTVLRCFHRQLRAKAGVFVEGLIAGAPPEPRYTRCWTSAWSTQGCLAEPSTELLCKAAAFDSKICRERCKLQRS